MSPMPSKKKKENTVKDEVKKLLTTHGWTHWPVAQNMYSEAGVSDRHAVKDGVYMAVEAKRDRNHHPTENQKKFLKSIQAQSCLAFVVNDETVKNLADFLDAYDRAVVAASRSQEPTEEDKQVLLVCAEAMTKEFM